MLHRNRKSGLTTEHTEHTENTENTEKPKGPYSVFSVYSVVKTFSAVFQKFIAAVTLFAAAHFAHALEINTATRAQLEQLNGIGVTMAEKILVERDKAPFRDWDDLQHRVKGMRGARTQRLQGSGVIVNGIPGSRATQEERK